MKMRASFIVAPRTSEVREIDVPEPEAGEILVKVKVCGVCASDLGPWLDPWDEKAIPPHAVNAFQIGHEPVGVVTAVGEGVTEFKAGDRVASMAAPAYAEYVSLPAVMTVHVLDDVPFEQAIVEPSACMISAIERVPLAFGEPVALIGCGFMGLLMLQLLRARGVGKIVAIDINEEALKNAQRFGADEVYTPSNLPAEYLCLEWDQMWDTGFSKVFEVTGKQKGIDLAIKMCKAHADLIAAGYHQEATRTIDMKMTGWKAIHLLNAHERRISEMAHGMRASLDLIQRGQLDMASLVTHHFKLDELDQAFTTMLEKPKGYIKGIVSFESE